MVPRVVRFVETESRVVVTRGMGLVFNEDRVSVWKEERCSGDDSGAGHTTMQIHLMLLNYILKND